MQPAVQAQVATAVVTLLRLYASTAEVWTGGHRGKISGLLPSLDRVRCVQVASNRLHGREQLPHFDLKGGGDAHEVQRGDVALSPLHRPVVGTADPRLVGEVFLGDTSLAPNAPDLLAQRHQRWMFPFSHARTITACVSLGYVLQNDYS